MKHNIQNASPFATKQLGDKLNKIIKESAIRKGASRPTDDSPFWNEWAANNPQPEAEALAKVDVAIPIQRFIKGVTTGARSVDF